MSPGILIIFSIILFWTYYTSYTNIDLVHSFTGNSFKFDFGATEESKSPPSDRRSDVKSNGILFPSFSLLTVGYHSSFHTSRHYFSPRWSNNLFAEEKFSLLTVGNCGTFSLLTVGNTDNFKYGAGENFSLLTVGNTDIYKYGAGGKFSLLTVGYTDIFKYGAGGKFSLLTVGNTDIFKYGAGGEGVTWPGKWRG